MDASYSGYVNYVVFRALPGDQFRVNVTGVAMPPQTGYRVIVSGDGFSEGTKSKQADADVFNHFNFEGPHLYTYRD